MYVHIKCDICRISDNCDDSSGRRCNDNDKNKKMMTNL